MSDITKLTKTEQIQLIIEDIHKHLRFVYNVLDNNHHKNSMDRVDLIKSDLNKIVMLLKK